MSGTWLPGLHLEHVGWVELLRNPSPVNLRGAVPDGFRKSSTHPEQHQMEVSMGAQQSNPTGPDLATGIPIDDLPDGHMLAGHIGDDAVLLARRGNEFFAIGATCSHYGGPLAEGLVVDDAVHCPWHHARFSLRTGEAIGAPAFNPMSCWRVEQRDGKVFVRAKIEPPEKRRPARTPSQKPERIVIVGGGAAGFAAAEMLRRDGFAGSLTMLSTDDAAPYDRPNCSKDYL